MKEMFDRCDAIERLPDGFRMDPSGVKTVDDGYVKSSFPELVKNHEKRLENISRHLEIC